MRQTDQNTTGVDSFPNYKNPPINEVVCGLKFHPPANYHLPLIGLLWDKLKREYPIVQHAQPIASARGEVLIEPATSLPIPRVWFINQNDDQLIQFQFDRFYFNWRRKQNDYPRYNYVIKKFEETYDIIIDFFNEHSLGELDPIECELSYINHIPKGECWNSVDDIAKIFRRLNWVNSQGTFLPSPDKISWLAEFTLPSSQGRLVVSLNQALQIEERIPLLILELKTIGAGDDTCKEGIFKWFDVAHEWIVRGFTDLTTTEVHEIWEKV